MIKRISSIVGFAALFILGTPSPGYSDSLPALAGNSFWPGYESCFQPAGGTTIKNTCSIPGGLPVVISAQSRAAGYWNFYAVGTSVYPQTGYGLQCWVYGTDYNSGYQFQGYNFTVNGQLTTLSLGRQYVSSNTVIHYYCNLPAPSPDPNLQLPQLYSVYWTQ